MSYYEQMASPESGEFDAELKRAFSRAAAHPESYPARKRDLSRFPHHFLSPIGRRRYSDASRAAPPATPFPHNPAPVEQCPN
jgi:hypothetical protein